jgi:2-(1,2-epoxy-1,2-dihydrophenyl)acetyl-CoA isomerase
MVLLGEGARGAEAVELGLAYRCYPSPSDLEYEASALAARLAAGPIRSMGLSKQLLNSSFESDLTGLLDREAQAQAMAAVSPEMAEGMAAFAEKRSPDFRSAR